MSRPSLSLVVTDAQRADLEALVERFTGYVELYSKVERPKDCHEPSFSAGYYSGVRAAAMEAVLAVREALR